MQVQSRFKWLSQLPIKFKNKILLKLLRFSVQNSLELIAINNQQQYTSGGQTGKSSSLASKIINQQTIHQKIRRSTFFKIKNQQTEISLLKAMRRLYFGQKWLLCCFQGRVSLLLGIYSKVLFHNSYNYKLAFFKQKPMQQYYFLDNSSTIFYYYPSFYNFSEQCPLPTLRNISEAQLPTSVPQPKTNHSTTSLQTKKDKKQRLRERCPSKEAQRGGKRQEVKTSKPSIIDSIQLQNRNILPNTTNVLLSYIRRINKSGKEVKRVLQALKIENLQYAIKRFYAYQNFLKNNVNDFIIRNGIRALMNHLDPSCSCFSIEDQIKFNKVFRIVIIRYLQNDYLEFILTSNKMEDSKRKDHLKVRRYLIQALNNFSNRIQPEIQ